MTDNRTADALPPDQIRVTDAEREAVAERLRQAHDEGSLDLNEFDDRTARLYGDAKTRGDLAAITADLPAPASAAPSPALPDQAKTLRVVTAAWLGLALVSFVIWVGVGLSGPVSDPDPAWMWVVLAPGSILGVLWATGFGRRSR
jgi:hypothetical protein